MAEMMKELQEFEDQYFALRCQLRQLSGKVGLFTSQEHERSVDFMQSASDRSAKDMLKFLTYALSKLDQYEFQRSYWFEREAGFEKIQELSYYSHKQGKHSIDQCDITQELPKV